MMKSLLIIIVALCCLARPAESRAQDIYTYSDVQPYPDDPTRVIAVGSMQMDYSAQVYYYMRVEVSIWSTGASPETYDFQAYDASDVTWLWGCAWVSYDSAAEYDTKMNPKVTAYFRSEDWVFYRDYYNFAVYEDGLPALWPSAGGAYGFTGPGPERDISFSQILLGTLSGVFSAGSAHGTPDHLRVISDNTVNDCGSRQRRIRFQVVDDRGRRVTGTRTGEQFLDKQWGTPISSAYNSCEPGDPIHPASCTADLLGVFTDQLWAGCPDVNGDCGTSEFLSRWRWCPLDRQGKTLSTNTYYIRRDEVLVNGIDDITSGTELR